MGITSNFASSIKKLSVGLLGKNAADPVRTSRVSVVDGTCANIQDGISYFRLSGEALDEVRRALAGAREIFARARTGELTGAEREEAARIIRGIDARARSARFKDAQVFRPGDAAALSELLEKTDGIVSELAGASHRLDMTTMPLGEVTASSLEIDDLEREPQQAVSRLDSAIGVVTSCRAVIEAQISRMERVASKLRLSAANVVAAGSRIVDADQARAVVATAKIGILKKAGMSLAGQANQRRRSVISLMQQ
jgi:flagellin